MLKQLRQRHEERIEKGVQNSSEKKFFSLDLFKNLKIAYIPYNELFKEGVVAGIGWAIGVTLGFVIISTVLVVILKQLGGIPFVGRWIAAIVEETQQQLLKRTPIIPQ